MKTSFDPTLFFVLMLSIPSPIFAQSPQLIWGGQMGGSQEEELSVMTVDATGSVYIIGRFRNEGDFNPGPATSNLTTNNTVALYLVKLSAQGQFQWARAIGDQAPVGSWIVPAFAEVKPNGRLFVTGTFSGEIDFDPGSGVFTLNTLFPFSNVFRLELSSTGVFVDAQKITGPYLGYTPKMALDTEDHLLIAGRFSATQDLDPSPASQTCTSNGLSDPFLQKIDKQGNLVWVACQGGPGMDWITTLKTDAEDQIYTAGYFEETADLDPGPDTLLLESAGSRDVFVQKLDPDGNLLWARSLGGPGSDAAGILAIDDEGNVFLAGSFRQTADLDPGPGLSEHTALGEQDIFLVKLNAEGAFQWARSLGSTGIDAPSDLAIDQSGAILLTGSFNEPIDLDPGPETFDVQPQQFTDQFLLKLDKEGNFEWAGVLPGAGFPEMPTLVELGPDNNPFLAGAFFSTTDLDPGPGTLELATKGLNDIFITKWTQGPTSVGEIRKDAMPLLFPNPTAGLFSVEWAEPVEDAVLSVFSPSGQLLQRHFPEGQTNFSATLTGPAGWYLVRLEQSNGKSFTWKIVKSE